MSDERALRQELETLQHQRKALRAEQALPNGPKFVETRDGLMRQLLEETPALVREAKLAASAEAQEAELNASIELGRAALAAAEQRKLSPALALVPMLSFCLLTAWATRGDTLLADKSFARVLATLSAAIAGGILGSKLWAPSIHQAPFRERAQSWLTTNVLSNAALWAVVPLGASLVLLITSGSSLSSQRIVTFVESGWCQAAALTAFALAVRALSSADASHRSLGRIEAMVAGATLLGSALLSARVLTNPWFNGGGPLIKAALGVAVTVPFVAGLVWFWLARGKRSRPTALWAVPAVLSLVATAVLLANARPEAEEVVEVPQQELEYTSRDAPRVPQFLVREEAEAVEAARLVAEARSADPGEPGSRWLEKLRGDGPGGHAEREIPSFIERRAAGERVIATRRSVDVVALLLALQFGLCGVLGAWFFGATSTGRRRWLVRAVPLAPVALLVVTVFVRG